MSIKTQYLLYSAKNFSTGLVDVTANIFKDGNVTPVATGVALSELSAVSCPGRYLLTLTPVQLVSFGGVGTYKVCINSVSKPAPATAKLIVVANDNDDLDATLQILDGKLDTITADIAAVQGDVTSVKATVENSNTVLNSVSFGNSALKGLIDAVSAQVSSMQNATRTIVAVAPQLVKPASGLKDYKVEISIFNVQGFLEDPDANVVTLNLQNASGNDRGNLFKAHASGPLNATRISAGIYSATIEISASDSEETLSLLVDYTENGGVDSMRAQRATEVVANVQAAGFALETTAQDILTDTADMQPRIANIEGLASNVTFGFSALKDLIDAAKLVIDDTNSKINDAGFGLSALSSDLSGKATQISVDNIATDITNNVKGAGFSNTTDSLKAISDRQFTGGTAV